MKKFWGIGILIGLMLIITVNAQPAAGLAGCPTDNTWTGDVSTAWDVAGNWSCDVVPANTNVTIPASAAPDFPVIPNPGLLFVNDLTIEAGASLDVNGASVIINGTMENNGTLIDRRTIPPQGAAPESCLFCYGNYHGLHLSRDEAAGGDPGVVEVKISGSQGTCDTGNSTIGRCFEIIPTNKENISLDAIFYFQPEELNGLTCAELHAYHWDGSGWVAAGLHNTVDCETSASPDYAILTDNITDFSYFVGATGIPLAVSLVDFSPENGVTSVIIAAGVAIGLLLMAALMIVRRRQTDDS